MNDELPAAPRPCGALYVEHAYHSAVLVGIPDLQSICIQSKTAGIAQAMYKLL